MKFKLRLYQALGIEQLKIRLLSLIQKFKDRLPRPIFCLPTGGGKTVCFASIVEKAQRKGSRVLIACHRAELVEQAKSTLTDYRVNPLMVYYGMVQTFVRSPHKIPDVDLCIIDECFIKGTLIDGVPIESVKIGDYVNSFNHLSGRIESRKVVDVMKRKPVGSLYKVNYLDVSHVLTENHPIFVIGKGYVQAKNLNPNDRVCRLLDLPELQEGIVNEILQDKHLEIEVEQNKEGWKGLLLSRMQKQFLCRNAFKTNDRKEPNEKRGGKKKSFSKTKRHWAQAKNKRRKWSANARSSENAFRIFRRRLVWGTCYCDRRGISPSSLQNRYRSPIKEGVNRSGRNESLIYKSSERGYKEREFLKEERVVNIEVLKPGDIYRYSDGFVYNIQVDGNENYFANGVLTHNCHIGNFRKFVDLLPSKVQVIGVTATPVGANKKMPLRDVFDTVVSPVQISDLIKDGYLSTPTYYRWKVDESKLEKDFKGEYTEASQAKVFSLEDLKDAYTKRIGKTIIFASSIAQAEAINEMLPDTFLVHSKMKSEERKNIVQEYKRTPDATIINCGILTAGFDDPFITTVIVYRATTSLTLWLQMCGRGSRVIEGVKTRFYIFDMGGNLARLLAWEAPRDWEALFDLQGRKLKDQAAPMKECATCEAIIYASAKICPYCNSEQPIKPKQELKADGIEIINSYSELPKHLQKPYGDMSVQELIERAQYGSPHTGRPFKIGWVLAQIKPKENYTELLHEVASVKGYKKGWVLRNL